jgi:hypothetical protein
MQGRATTIVDVVNLSLRLLGEDKITTITPQADSEAGRKMVDMLYVSIDEVQRSFYWHELITTADISEDATDHYDGRKRYALPADCLRPLGARLESDGLSSETAYTRLVAQESEYHYDIEGDFLLTTKEEAEIDIVYIKRSDDPTEWSSELLDCIYHCAAVNAAQSITQDSGIVQNILQKYEQLVKPHARRLQSKYKTDRTLQPRRFDNFQIHRG